MSKNMTEEPTAGAEGVAENTKRTLRSRVIGVQRRLVEFQKAIVEGTIDGVVAFQDQQEQLINNILDRSSVIPEEGKDLVNEWIDTFKKGRDDFKATVDKSFDLVDTYLDRLAGEGEEDEIDADLATAAK